MTTLNEAIATERRTLTAISRASRAEAAKYNKTCVFVSRLSVINRGLALPVAWEASCIVDVLNRPPRIRPEPYTLDEFGWHLL